MKQKFFFLIQRLYLLLPLPIRFTFLFLLFLLADCVRLIFPMLAPLMIHRIRRFFTITKAGIE